MAETNFDAVAGSLNNNVGKLTQIAYLSTSGKATVTVEDMTKYKYFVLCCCVTDGRLLNSVVIPKVIFDKKTECVATHYSEANFYNASVKKISDTSIEIGSASGYDVTYFYGAE